MVYAGLELVERSEEYFFEDSQLWEAWHNQHLTSQPDQKAERLQYRQRTQAQQALRKTFMDKHGLKETKFKGDRFRKLVNPKAGVKRDDYGHDAKYDNPATKWFDHDELFYDPTNQRYVLTTQPYDLSLDKFKQLEQYCAGRGIALAVSYQDAWHYPGRCPLVVLFGRSV